jgi:hypothetical protein
VLRDVNLLSRFSTTAPSSNLQLVKTISIASPPLRVRWPQTDGDESVIAEHDKVSRSFNQHLDSLSTLLPRMKHLTSFSLQIGSPHHSHRERHFIVKKTALHNLVSSLPPSVRHLELDTRYHERVAEVDAQQHLCPAIAERLTHLHSLRLRLGTLCCDLFCPSESLRSLVINMIEAESTTQASECGQTAMMEPGQSFAERQVIGQKTSSRLAVAGLNSATSMPNLRTFIILDAESWIDRIDRPLGVDMLRVRDMLRNQSTTFPLFRIELDYDQDAEVYPMVLRKLPDTDADDDIAGRIEAVEVFAEGGVWGNTTAGSRLPTCLKNDSEGHRHHWDDKPPYLTKQQFLGLPAVLNVEFWRMEKKAGKQLVQARIQDGVVDLEPLVRDTYESPPASDDEDDEDDEDDDDGWVSPDYFDQDYYDEDREDESEEEA